MNEASDLLSLSRRVPCRLCGAIGLLAIVLGLIQIDPISAQRTRAADPPAGNPEVGKEPSIGGLKLFDAWQKDHKPDAAIVLSGETFGFLQPCGCSRPQKGGLERRAQFIQTLKAKGWPVAGIDLGDIYPKSIAVREQGLLKYKTTMNALREMGYIAVGLGKNEFKAQTDSILGEYALQKAQPPFTLAGNLLGAIGPNGIAQRRQERFQVQGAARPLVDEAEFATIGGLSLSAVGIIGKSVAEEVATGKFDSTISFEGNNKGFLQAVVANLTANPAKPELNLLLFQGTSEEAKLLAQDYPQFHAILCLADDSEPPQYPAVVAGKLHGPGQRTLIIQVGHKGRYVGVLGAFKKPMGGVELHYQLVPLGEEYVTPGTEAQAQQKNPILPILEGYAKQVRDWKLIDDVPRVPHPSQILQPTLNLSYIGSTKCQGCHQAEFAKWQTTHHSTAFSSLEKVAKRPSLRQFDGECAVCHTVGLGFNTGYVDQQKTPNLLNVGCENCHGPGSGHAAEPKNKTLLELQSPWKQKLGDSLPDQKFMDRMASLNGSQRGQQQIPPATLMLINKTSEMCMRCHNDENDPHFDLYSYWPKIVHNKK